MPSPEGSLLSGGGRVCVCEKERRRSGHYLDKRAYMTTDGSSQDVLGCPRTSWTWTTLLLTLDLVRILYQGLSLVLMSLHSQLFSPHVGEYIMRKKSWEWILGTRFPMALLTVFLQPWEKTKHGSIAVK